MNRKLSFLLIGIGLVLALAWFFSTRDSKVESRRAALEKRLSEIPFSVENLFPNDAAFNLASAAGSLRLRREQINDSTLVNSQKYLDALVIGIIRADYEKGEGRYKIEIAQFASPNDAYGFYSQNRPAGIPFDTVGTESYFFDSTFYFTKSSFAVSVKSISDNDKYAASKSVAKVIDANIAESSLQPLFFRLFPYRDQLVPSQRYFSLNYLGVELFDEVYTVDYVIDDDTLTLFLTTDTSGEKLLLLSDWGEKISDITNSPSEIEFPERFSISFEHPLHGQIVAGVVNRKMAGVIGYERATGMELFGKWIAGLK